MMLLLLRLMGLRRVALGSHRRRCTRKLVVLWTLLLVGLLILIALLLALIALVCCRSNRAASRRWAVGSNTGSLAF